MKHKKKQMIIEDLRVRLRIEEHNMKFENASYKTMESKTNIIEGGKSSKNRKNSGAGSSQREVLPLRDRRTCGKRTA